MFVTLPKLVVPLLHAQQELRTQIGFRREIGSRTIKYEFQWQSILNDRSEWVLYNILMLVRLFENLSVAEEYSERYAKIKGHGLPLHCYRQDSYSANKLILPLSRDLDVVATKLELAKFMNQDIEPLQLILDHLDAGTKTKERVVPAVTTEQNEIVLSDIFIVHGHAEAARESVARFVEKLGLRAIVLHEQPSGGSKSVIEKLETYSNVGFAIVLLTPDDIGASQAKRDETKPRARQNVILELGYFMGKLGRGRVCALYKEGVEIPSDYEGVLYIPMDAAGAWRMALAKEIKNAGIEVDLNKL